MQRMVDSMVKYHNKIASTAPGQETTEGSTKKKNKYAYDSDEDTHGGTWEHKQRTQEMTETRGTHFSMIPLSCSSSFEIVFR